MKKTVKKQVGVFKAKSMFASTAIYPGTFDPITNGHLDIIKRASLIFENLIVGVALNSEKTAVFTPENRKQMIIEAAKEQGIKNIEVVLFKGLLVNFAKENGARVIVRGLRAVSDFEYEFQMACVNNRLDSNLETIFLPSSDDMHFISSRFIRSIASLKGDISKFVPKSVIKRLDSILEN
jgi:pantetheine-phosphate adenylyltransferase